MLGGAERLASPHLSEHYVRRYQRRPQHSDDDPRKAANPIVLGWVIDRVRTGDGKNADQVATPLHQDIVKLDHDWGYCTSTLSLQRSVGGNNSSAKTVRQHEDSDLSERFHTSERSDGPGIFDVKSLTDWEPLVPELQQ